MVPPEQIPEIDPDNGDQWQRGVPKGVEPGNAAIGDAERPRGADVFLMKGIDHRCAKHAQIGWKDGQRDRDGWQHQTLPAVEAHRREPAKVHREDQARA